jgi:hypothetical protein
MSVEKLLLDPGISDLIRKRKYTACVYWRPKSFAQLRTEQLDSKQSTAEWAERQREISAEELAGLNFVGVPVLMEHRANADSLELAVAGLEEAGRRPAGVIVGQSQDPNDGSQYVDIRCYDTVDGQWMCRMLEEGRMQGFSIGHRKDPVGGGILLDEVSYCVKGKRPGTRLVSISNTNYDENTTWTSDVYKPPEWTQNSHKAPVQSQMSMTSVPGQLPHPASLAGTPTTTTTTLAALASAGTGTTTPQQQHPAAMLPVLNQSSSSSSSSASSAAGPPTLALAEQQQTGTTKEPTAKRPKIAMTDAEIDAEVEELAKNPEEHMAKLASDYIHKDKEEVRQVMASLASAVARNNKRKAQKLSEIEQKLKTASEENKQLMNNNDQLQAMSKRQIDNFLGALDAVQLQYEPLKSDASISAMRDRIKAFQPSDVTSLINPLHNIISVMSSTARAQSLAQEEAARRAQAAAAQAQIPQIDPATQARLAFLQRELQSRDNRAMSLVSNTMPAATSLVASQASASVPVAAVQQQVPQQQQQQLPQQSVFESISTSPNALMSAFAVYGGTPLNK